MRKNAIHDTTEAVFRGRVRSITLLKSSFRTAEKPLSGHGKACMASRKSLFGHAERAFRWCGKGCSDLSFCITC